MDLGVAPVWKIQGLLTLLTAADVDKIVTTVSMKNGAYDIAAQPAIPARVSVTATAGATADTLGIVTFVGTNMLDEVISEVITPVAGSTVYGELYFKTVTTATGSGWVIDAVEGTNDTITVGVSMDSEIICRGRKITFLRLSGNIWFNPLAVAVADATSIKWAVADPLTLIARNNLRIISDGSGATFEYFIWEY